MTSGGDASAGSERGSAALQLQPFDFSRDIPSDIPELDLPAGPEHGRLVEVRASSRARDKDWAVHAAVAIAGHWASRGARVLLVDLCFDEPHLHRAFNSGNLEGISDAIEYGASLRRIARPANDGSFWVATAGTPVANPRRLLHRPAWHRLLATLVEGGVMVVAYQAAESPFHPRGTPSVVLACKGEPMGALGRVGLRDAVALLGPAPNGTSVTTVTGKEENRLGDQAYRASLWHGFDDEAEEDDPSVAEAEPAPAPAATVPAQPANGAEPGTASRDRGRGLSISAFVVLVLFAALMILLGIDNAGIADVPGADQLRELFENLLARVSRFFAR
jgi:hypothetical protein